MKEDKFQKSLKKAIFECDSKLDRKEILIDIFKTYVAKMMEANVDKNKGRLEADYLTKMKGFIITEFRNTDLQEHQISEGGYSKLFDDTIQEIFNDAANAHEGEDTVKFDPTKRFEINKTAYHNEVIAKRNKNGDVVTEKGIILPGATLN